MYTTNRNRISYETDLNSEQLEAVTHDKGALLVIAGAGSGKTRTLTYRVARLVEEGIPPGNILLLTFTRKAALEMLHRATNLLDSRCEKVAGGTFHSFSHIMLRRYAPILGFSPNFAIIDRGDAENLISMIRKETEIEKDRRSFPKKQTLASLFSRSINKAQTLEDIVYDDYPHFIPFLDAIIDLQKRYILRKMEHNFLDYDDLLIHFRLLLDSNPEIRERIAASFQYVMVDEYQDTNLIQAEIVTKLANEDHNVMVVGDDSQSIYAFRGAQFQNIMRFPEIFPNTRIIRLEENYRSTQPVLDLTNRIIARAKQHYEKHLFTRHIGGMPPQLVRASSENGQSRFVVEKILALRNQGIPYNEAAVLFRSSYHSFDLEIELNRSKIPYVKVGGFKFIESAHIKDVLAYFKVLIHPKDRISWYRILLLLEKIGPKTAVTIFDRIQREENGWRGLLRIKTKPAWDAEIKRLAELFTLLDNEQLSVARLGETIVRYYTPILRNTYEDHPKRAKDLEHLITIMERYEKVTQFVNDMALEPPNTAMDGSLSTDDASHDRLVLSTIHSAKGLEWHTVFILSSLDGRFPSFQAIHNEAELEEERRLMYVAATRAKENLYIMYPSNVYDKNTGNILYKPSCFVDGLPDHILEPRRAGSDRLYF